MDWKKLVETRTSEAELIRQLNRQLQIEAQEIIDLHAQMDSLNQRITALGG